MSDGLNYKYYLTFRNRNNCLISTFKRFCYLKTKINQTSFLVYFNIFFLQIKYLNLRNYILKKKKKKHQQQQHQQHYITFGKSSLRMC